MPSMNHPSIRKKKTREHNRDWFPELGQLVKNGEPLCAIFDESTGRHMLKRHKKGEDVYVEEIRLIGGDGQGTPCEKATLKLRM